MKCQSYDIDNWVTFAVIENLQLPVDFLFGNDLADTLAQRTVKNSILNDSRIVEENQIHPKICHVNLVQNLNCERLRILKLFQMKGVFKMRQ